MRRITHAIVFILLSSLSLLVISTQSFASMGDNQVAMRKLLAIYKDKSGEGIIDPLSSLLSENLRAMVWTGREAVTVSGKSSFINKYLQPELNVYKDYKVIVGQKMVGHFPANNDPVFIIFYKVEATLKDGSKTQWAGCNLYQFHLGKIIMIRVQPDTYTQGNGASNIVSLTKTYQMINKYYQPQTSAKNRIGMMKLLDLKRSHLSSRDRITQIIAMLSPAAEQTSWEPGGIKFLPNVAKIKKMFQTDLLSAFPDFYEGVENYIISGNALILLQNPSGTMTTQQGKHKFNAWYNCDIYFFGGQDGKQVTYLLFQRDTLMDHRQITGQQ